MPDQPRQTTPAQRRHVPQRTCIACRATDAKRALIRLVRLADGRVAVDPTGRVAGRGAYLCHSPACWRQAIQRRSIVRALRLDALYPEDEAVLYAYAQHLEDTMAAE